VRHFGTELGTPKPAVFALEAATSVRSSSLFDPMMRSSSVGIEAGKHRLPAGQIRIGAPEKHVQDMPIRKNNVS
jgi:hypothetical protein